MQSADKKNQTPSHTSFTENSPSFSFGRRSYLHPTRYFHFYLFYERRRHSTCWLPEGYAR